MDPAPHLHCSLRYVCGILPVHSVVLEYHSRSMHGMFHIILSNLFLFFFVNERNYTLNFLIKQKLGSIQLYFETIAVSTFMHHGAINDLP